MRVLGVGMLVASLLAAGFAAFRDGEALNPTTGPNPAMMAGDGGSGMPPTPAP